MGASSPPLRQWLPGSRIPVSKASFGTFSPTYGRPGARSWTVVLQCREYTSEGIREGSVYPPVTALVTLPIALLPYQTAAVLWLFILVASVLVALRVCGVRDPRCLALALISPAGDRGSRLRKHRASRSSRARWHLGLAGSSMAKWDARRPCRCEPSLHLASRGLVSPYSALARCGNLCPGPGVVFSFFGWAAVGFQGVGDYFEVTRRNASEYVDIGVSVASVIANLGGSPGVITIGIILAGALAIAMAWKERADDLVCLTWTIVAALFASPDRLAPLLRVAFHPARDHGADALESMALAVPHTSSARAFTSGSVPLS